MDLPASVLGFTVSQGETPNLGSYPIFYTLHNDISLGSIGDTECMFVAPKGTIRLPMLVNMIGKLQAGFKMPCVIVSQSLSKYQVTRLCQEGIAWINSEDTLFLPFLGLSFLSFSEPEGAKPLSPQAQRLAIHIINGSWVGKSTSEVAQLLGKSLASTSNYFKEIELVLPQVIGSQGRKRFIAEVKDASAAELLETFEPYLSSPVASSVYLKFKDSKEDFLSQGCFYAGITALSMLTMLADDHWTTYATDEYNHAYLDEYADRMNVVEKDDVPDILLEIWNYDIDADGDRVDDISLYLSLKDNDEDDPRLDDALETLKKRFCS